MSEHELNDALRAGTPGSFYLFGANMNAELFNGDADGPDLVINKAEDGAPLTDCRGRTCGYCETLYATKEQAEMCCGDADSEG